MKRLIILSICLLSISELFAWGQKGHDITAYIAECHLTPTAAEKVDEVLGGHSLVYYANWLDVASHTPEYAYSRTWHYLNIDENETYESMEKNIDGDVLTAVPMLIDKLNKGALSAEDEALTLKMLIHLMGDMHCPMHMGRRSDLGGNLRAITLFNVPTNMHSAWDTGILESAHRWGYTEWQSQIDRLSDDEVVLMQAGEPMDWVLETHEICKGIYDDMPEGFNISYDYVERYAPVIEMQLLKGGHRLARLLNEIYQ